MARADRLKEEIGWLKLVFGVLAAVDTSLVAWLAQNHESESPLLVRAGFAATVLVTLAILWTFALVGRQLKKLEEA